jgi:hypothetical protein
LRENRVLEIAAVDHDPVGASAHGLPRDEATRNGVSGEEDVAAVPGYGGPERPNVAIEIRVELRL